jgi:glutaconyl-CoA/methylmalonyl-CoA decarboxylase subunit delta
MQTLIIFLQFGAKMDDSLSSFQLFLFWGIIVLFIALFIFFLIRTDKLINTSENIQSDSHKLDIGQVSDEEAASIALAIHMYKVEMHDKESLTITLKKVSRIYSPWSSKIYTLRQNPR